MKTKAVRLYGENDLRLEEFELPEIGEDEILAHIISDSICMSSHKETIQGARHKRVPEDVDRNPIIIGHEFCGEIVKVGSRWKAQFEEGQRFSIQPAINHPEYMEGMAAPGYSFQYIGGDATYIVIPKVVMEQGCLLEYTGEAYYMGSLAEPMSCIVGTFHAMYHTRKESYVHDMGIVEGGNMAILAGVGPMGLGAIDYAIHNARRPSLLVVTDIDDARLKRASELYTPAEAARHGVELHYVNTKSVDDPVEHLKSYTNGEGYDDVMVFAPVAALFEQADRILGYDGCLNFFAGPTNPELSAQINIYDVHYASHHLVGTSGGNTEDMKESLEMMSRGIINPSAMITHVGGLDAVADTTIRLPEIPGGKKLMYPNVSMELTAIEDFAEKGESDPMFARLAEIVERHNGLWNAEAEKYLLENAKAI
ncbi:MAG: zinc-binding dehydrogenase [Alkalispirochaetaceae bacterium]